MNQHLFFFFLKGRFRPIDSSSIMLIESDSNYSHIYTKDQAFTIIGQLHALEKKLPPESFCRVHRQYIISIKHIRYVSRQHVGIGDRDIPLSDKYYRDLMSKILVIR